MFPQTEYSIDGGETQTHTSYFTDLTPYINAEGEEDESTIQLASPTDYVASTTLGIDIKFHFSMDGLTKNGFSKKEISAFNLHFLHGFNVSEVAEQMNISISQASKVISKAREKAQLIFAITQTSNLN